MDNGVDRDGIKTFGALGIGGLKMKIHKACIAKLFERNDLVLDAESILEVARVALITSAVDSTSNRACRASSASTPAQSSIDLCGLDDGRRLPRPVAADGDALANPSSLCSALLDAAHRDCAARPRRRAVRLRTAAHDRARDLTDTDVRLAQLTAAGEDRAGSAALGR